MTVLLPSWYYEKKDLKRSPSIVDGLDVERESRYRREGARFIINVGTKMGLRYDTMATGVVYFHRFYMFHSFKTFPRYVTACCCLFLAGKVEETPKKCKDIIRTAKYFLAESQFAQFGDDPKEEVMTLERILLQTIKFDLQVDHPYGHLLKYAKSLKGDKIKLQNMVQMAWTFINDSLCTTLCLQWEPEVIAIALMHLAGKLSKFEVVDWNGRTPKHKDWWDMFIEGMTIELLEDICHQVLDLYSMPNPKTPQDSPPATPPTKQTRKTSQPPSPIETATSPVQMKSKDPPVGQPIPRLEPGELKRKSSHPEKELPEPVKIPRMTEGKAIPTISSRSPRPVLSSIGSDNQPSSPSPPQQEPVKSMKENPRTASEPVFKTAIVPKQPSFTSVVSSDTSVVKPGPLTPQAIVTSVPPPTSTFTQSNPPYFSEAQPFPNMQQPPPQMFPQRPPVSFQHPPPVPPSGPPPPPPGVPPPAPQYTPTMPPPFNSQYPPPPRHQPLLQPPNLSNPPPGPVPGMTQHPPPGHPPVPSMMHNVPPPPPPGVHNVQRMGQDRAYHNQSDVFNSDQHGRPPKPMNQNFGPRPHFEGNFRGRRDSDYDFPHDPSFCRPPPPPGQFSHEFDRSPNPGPRRFLLDQPMRKHDRGLLPMSPMGNPPQHGAPTGIPPVRITGSK